MIYRIGRPGATVYTIAKGGMMDIYKRNCSGRPRRGLGEFCRCRQGRGSGATRALPEAVGGAAEVAQAAPRGW